MFIRFFGVREERCKHAPPVSAEVPAMKSSHLPSAPAASQGTEDMLSPPVEFSGVPADLYRKSIENLQEKGRRLLKGLCLILSQIRQCQRQQQDFAQKVQLMEQGYQRELQTIRVCQQQTAQILNHELERHALNPAIEALATVAEEFWRLEQKVAGLKSREGLCPAWAEVVKELDISAAVIAEKLRSLDIVILRPECNEPFDAAKHDICSQAETCDSQMQGKIQSVVSSGIQYRNKLLKRAHIVVYRLKFNKPIIQENKNENEKEKCSWD